MKKIIIFYALLTIIVILSASEMNWITVPAFVGSIILLGSYVCSMTSNEIMKVSGAYFFNSALNTNDFTEE